MTTVNPKPYITPELAQINPDVHTMPYWESCRKQELRIQRCKDCGKFRHPPLPGCINCGSFDVEWAQLSGKGTVYSFCLPYHPVVPSLAVHVPYNVVLVELEGGGGVRLLSNLLDTPLEEICVGMPVELVWDKVTEEVTLPRFRPVKA